MAYSIENKKINKCNGELSLHVLDIIQSTMKACTSGIPQKIKTTCKKASIFFFEGNKKNNKVIFKLFFMSKLSLNELDLYLWDICC